MTEINTTDLGFQAQIYNEVELMPDRIKFPDRSNLGKFYGLLLMWKRVEQLASKKYDALLEKLIKEDQLTDPKTISIPGNHTIGESGKIAIQVSVSQPRREFSADWLVKRLEKDYKVPPAITRQLIEEAKRPGNTNVRRITVSEKGAG
jgi:hypothetical protein